MITFPIITIFATYLLLSVVSVYALHVAQLCDDKVSGLVASENSARSLLTQKRRAEKTAFRCFVIGLLLAIILVGSLEFPYV